MATVKLELELVGSVDGVPVELVGSGSVDVDAGRLALEVRLARALLLLDPALVAIGLLDVLAMVAVRSGAMGDKDAAEDNPDAHVHVRSRTDLYDESGREAGGWRVVAALRRTGGGVRLDGQLLDHVARIEPGERVEAVDAPWGVLVRQLEPEGVLLASAWDARTGRGNRYRGVVTAVMVDGWAWPAAWAASEAVRIAVDDVQVRRTEHGSAGETVSIAARLVEENSSSGNHPSTRA